MSIPLSFETLCSNLGYVMARSNLLSQYVISLSNVLVLPCHLRFKGFLYL